MSDQPPYQVVFLSGLLAGASIERLREFGWTVVTAEREGFEVTTPSGMRLRVSVTEVER